MNSYNFHGKISEMVCQCLLPRAERKGLVQGHPIDFVPMVGLEFMPNCLSSLNVPLPLPALEPGEQVYNATCFLVALIVCFYICSWLLYTLGDISYLGLLFVIGLAIHNYVFELGSNINIKMYSFIHSFNKFVCPPISYIFSYTHFLWVIKN